MSAKTRVEQAIGCMLLCWVLAAPGSACAAWTLDQLMGALAQRGEASAQFVEVKRLRLLSQPLTLRGTLTYKAPDTLVKHTTKPNVEIMTVRGDRISIEVPARHSVREFTLQDSSVLGAFVESIRATLRGDRATLTRFYDPALSGDRAGWTLRLTPRDAKMRNVIRGIEIRGKDNRLLSIDIQETGGDRSTMTIVEDAR